MNSGSMALENVARSLGLDVDPIRLSGLQSYVDLLMKWNKVYNLTAIRNPEEAWSHHIFDSMAALASIQKFRSGASSVLDVGSGGGLPGVVWAQMEDSLRVTCIDAVAKKVAFIQQVANALPALNGRLSAVHDRVQDHALQYDIVTSRAFSALCDFVLWTRHTLKPGGYWVAMKGKWPEDEVARLPDSVEVFHVEQLAVPMLGEDRCLIWIRPKL